MLPIPVGSVTVAATIKALYCPDTIDKGALRTTPLKEKYTFDPST